MPSVIRDALKNVGMTARTANLELVELDMTLFSPGFLRRAFPATTPAHKLHDFGSPSRCIHESWVKIDDKDSKARCANEVDPVRGNGYLCVEHQKLLDRRKNLPKGSIYRFAPVDTGHAELIMSLLGAEDRAIEQSMANGRVWKAGHSRTNGDLIIIEP